MAFKIYLVKKNINNYDEQRLQVLQDDIVVSDLLCDDEPEYMAIFKVWNFFHKIDYLESFKDVLNKILKGEIKKYQVVYWFNLGSGQIYINNTNEKKILLNEIEYIRVKYDSYVDNIVRKYFNELNSLIKNSIELNNSTIVIDPEY